MTGPTKLFFTILLSFTQMLSTPVPADSIKTAPRATAKQSRQLEQSLPIEAIEVNGAVVPASRYSGQYDYPGLGKINYTQIDIMVSSKAEARAVLQYADRMSRTADHAMFADFVADDASGFASHKTFVALAPPDIQERIQDIRTPRDVVLRAERVGYEQFSSIRKQFLQKNYLRFARWGETGEYRKWLSIARFTGNAIGSFLSVVSGGAPMIGKLNFGLATGAMSAALMYYNRLYMGWLTTQRFASWAQIKTQRLWDYLGIPARKVLDVSEETSAIAKWNLLEVGFIAVQASLLKLMGMPIATTAGGYLRRGLGIGISGFFAQYFWDKANSDLWARYNHYVTDKKDRAFYETYSALKMVMVSWGQVTAASVALVYPRVGYTLLGIMTLMSFAFRKVVHDTTPDELISNYTGSAFDYSDH